MIKLPLGDESWNIWVIEVIENVTLYRPTCGHFFLKDALASTITWPKKHINALIVIS